MRAPLAWSAAAGALRTIGHALLPQHCALCAASAGDAVVCAACRATLYRIEFACPRCALPTPAAAVCGACLAHPPPYGASVAAFAYAFPVDRLLQHLKYGAALALADWAAAALAEAAVRARPTYGNGSSPTVLVPLPLARARQRERGFNQASEIARGVGRRLALPVRNLLVRVRSGVPQAALPWSGRARNVKDAFACQDDVGGRHIALVDDVMTTGETAAEAARTLLRQGARQVDLWVVARTLPPGGS